MQSFLITGIMVNARKGEIFWWRCHNYFFSHYFNDTLQTYTIIPMVKNSLGYNYAMPSVAVVIFQPMAIVLKCHIYFVNKCLPPPCAKITGFFFQIFSNKFSPLYFTNQSKVKQTVLFISVHPNYYTVCLYI